MRSVAAGAGWANFAPAPLIEPQGRAEGLGLAESLGPVSSITGGASCRFAGWNLQVVR
jgi:hypothetical protein